MRVARTVTGRFVHVVSSVDLDKRTGKILYVNPASSAQESGVEGDPSVELRFLGRDGNPLVSISPILHLASCEGRGTFRMALIQEDVKFETGMSSIELRIDGKTVDAYKTSQSAPGAILTPDKLKATRMQGVSPFAAPKMKVETTVGGDVEYEGVSYTVQAQPAPGTPWTTLAVGSKTPKFTVDANQFPGSRSVLVRVLKTDGFTEDVIAQDTVKF
jgi:hypothetical protein